MPTRRSTLNAIADAELKPADIDGIATAGETPIIIPPSASSIPRLLRRAEGSDAEIAVNFL
jgi:hypothetical protein